VRYGFLLSYISLNYKSIECCTTKQATMPVVRTINDIPANKQSFHMVHTNAALKEKNVRLLMTFF
jgi:hypothetical protein